MERPDLRPPVRGIDPDLAWDEDGECYLTWEGTVSGGQGDGIFQGRLDMKTGEFDGEPYPVWQGIGLAASEAPHLYRIGEHWYLILAEGGTERGHTDTIARADRPEEPVRVVPGQSRVLSPQPRPSGPEHRPSLVQTASGEWAAVYLAVRPGGFTPSFHVLGRETFLAGVDWVDGWPVFGEGRYEFTPTDTAFEDDSLRRFCICPGSQRTSTPPAARPPCCGEPPPAPLTAPDMNRWR
ncbi:MAG TPA: family 43 glycosylhydrolase [Glycomyces sp.]|nr:family 43 glycosylhydrolase [Glycomyces sp.]